MKMKFYSKRVVKIIGVCLAVAVFMASLPIISAMAEVSIPEADKDYFVGETLIDTNFDEFASGTLPEGWFAGKTAKGWSPNNGSEKYFSSIVDIAEGDATDHVLYFGSQNSDAWLMTEKLPVGDYIYETEITVSGTAGSIAISTQGFGNDYDSFTGATSLATYGSTALVTDTDKTTFKITGKGAIGFGSEKTGIAFPEGLDLFTSGTTVKYKVISFEGYNHYYVNDQLVYSLAHGMNNAVYGYERVGFYTYGGQFNVNSMKVTAIYTPLEYEPDTGLREGIDFIPGEDLIDDWTTSYTAIGPRGWWAGTPTVTANSDGSLSFGCKQDGVLGFGTISAADYVMEATVTHTGGAGIAFINNIDGSKPLANYDGTNGDTNIGSAMLSLVYPTSWSSNSGNKSIAYKDKNNNNNEYYSESLPASYVQPSVGDTYTLKLICLDGKNYFYFNDILVLVCDITLYRAGNTYVGFYVCNSSFTLHSFSVKELAPTPSFGSNIISNGVIIDEDFSSYEDGAFPEGWDKATDKYSSFLWKKNGTNDNYKAVVKSEGSAKFLEISASEGAHILTLPDIGTENYVFSANVGFQSFGNAFGLATNIQTDNENAKMATINCLYGCDIDAVVGGTQDWKYELPVISSYVRGGTGANDPKNSDPQLDYYAPRSVKNLAATTGGVAVDKSQYRIGTVAAGTVFNLKVYHIGGVSYFFVNDVYVNQVADQCTDAATKVGFYICTANQVMRVDDVKVEGIADMDNFDETLSVGAPVVYEDFADLTEGTLPEGWQLVATGWTWNGANGAAAVTTVDGVKGLKVSAKSGTAALILPDYKLSDYVVTIEGKLLNNLGSAGLLANVSSPAAESNGATHMISYVGSSYNDAGTDIYHYNRGGGAQNDQIKKTLADYGISHITQGATFKMTAYVIGGETYFFINDKFISKNVDAYQLATSLAGIYSCNAEVLYTNVTLAAVSRKGNTNAVTLSNVAMGYADILGNSENSGAAGLSFDFALNKTDKLYVDNLGGDYAVSDAFAAGIVVVLSNSAMVETITNGTGGAMELVFDEYTEDAENVYFSFDLIALGGKIDKYVLVRPFIKLGDDYYYGATVVAGAANEANKLYGHSQTTDELKAKLDKVFGDSDIFLGKNAKSVTFTVLSDLHYNEGQYMSSVADLEAIFDRANESNSSFVISAGDFCNNFKGSPELINTWLNNEYGLPAYNIYGNHELEAHNAMSYVTTVLTNDQNVVWGTADGKIGDGSIAYYYAEREGFRIVNLDTNYYWDPASSSYKHNPTNSYGPPSGISTYNCLGPTQLKWLEEVLTDAASKGIPCIVVSHDSFAGKFGSTSPDAAAVREIYAKANAIRRGTVLISINGHIHTNHQAIVDGVFYLDMNTVRNCVWKGGQTAHHYTDEHTFTKVSYDANGNPVSTDENAKLSSLSMGMATWFAADPLSAVITIDQYGNIKIDGTESDWIYGVVPPSTNDGEEPRVLSGEWKLDF